MDGLVRQATSQHGLLSTAQLRQFGITKSHQLTLIRQGLIQPVRFGVSRLAGAPTTWEQRLLAACLTPGAVAVASHRSALRIWGLRTRFDGLEVAVRYPKNRTLPDVAVHRSVDLIDADITVVDSIPVTSAARTLCDAGLIFPDHEVQRMVDHSVATGLVRPAELIEVRRRVGEHGRNGVVRLDQAIDGLPRGARDTESGPEVGLLRILIQAGLPRPVLQHRVRAGRGMYRLDVSYPDSMLGLEYDGLDGHSRIDRFVQDRRRQNELVGLGWTILRYTHADLRDRPGVLIGQVRRHLSDL